MIANEPVHVVHAKLPACIHMLQHASRSKQAVIDPFWLNGRFFGSHLFNFYKKHQKRSHKLQEQKPDGMSQTSREPHQFKVIEMERY